MLTDSLRFEARAVEVPDFTALKAGTEFEALEWGTGDRLLDALRRFGEIFAEDTELTGCSPPIPTAELTRIRNNVVAQYNALRNTFSNVGGSLDSRALVAQYQAVYSAMESDSYCHYASDAQLVRDIHAAAQGANQLLDNAFNQFATNFANRMAPVRTAHAQLQSAAANATVSVEPVINAYKAMWSYNFAWNLHQGLNGTLDTLINEYVRLYNGSETLFEQGVARVQGAFEAAVRQSNLVFAGFAKAYNHWDKTDGAMGYGMYVDNMRAYEDELTKLRPFKVVANQLNNQIFAEINQHVSDVKTQFANFPNFIAAQPTTGFALDPGTSSLKFHARQLTLNIAQGAGAHFNSQIAPGNSLIGTGFSYQHGGKMPPHSEHKNGKDCDIFSVHFKVGHAGYSEAKAIAMATWLLQAGVSRLIYTNPAVVQAANKAVPKNAVAVTGSGHETHMHFDVEQAA